MDKISGYTIVETSIANHSLMDAHLATLSQQQLIDTIKMLANQCAEIVSLNQQYSQVKYGDIARVEDYRCVVIMRSVLDEAGFELKTEERTWTPQHQEHTPKKN